MRMTRHSLVLLCAAMLASIPVQIQAQTAGAVVTDDTARVIVKLKADSPLLREQVLSATARATSRAQSLGQRLGLAMSAGSTVSDRSQVVFASGITSAELAQRLALEGDVEYAVPDQRRRHFVAPNDPLYADGVGGNGPAVGQWYLRAPTGAVQSSINVEAAWNVTTGSPGVVVAVLDTGVRFDHPDLLAVAAGGNLLPGYDMISDAAEANDGNGRDPDPSDPGDWLTQAEISQRGGPFFQCSTTPESSSWHGTQTAGLIAALTNNGIGMASVGRNVRVLPVRVLGKCGGFDSDIIAGMRWAAGMTVPGVPANPNRAQVINMSLGGEGACTAAYQDAVTAINAAGTVIVAAAGNSAGHAVGVPANCDGVIAVAGLRHAGTKVGFSDLGPEIAISAPGGNCVNVTAGSPCLYPILTTSNSGATVPLAPIYTDSFNPSLGTSFSAPLVAGTVALMLSAQPSMTPAQVRLALEATARPFPTTGGDNGDGTAVLQCTPPQFDALGNPVDQLQCYCTIDTCGAGMLDAGAAVLGATTGIAAAGVQAQGLWWNAPANSEAGWGISFAHQGSRIFATWFTYDLTGKGWWLSMTADKTGTNPDTYTGQLVETSGPAFSAMPFPPMNSPGGATATGVGTATLSFSDVNRASFNYIVNGTPQTKSLTRQVFGPLPTCVYGAQPNFAAAANYQDLWWAAPGGSESGWGVNLTHQGDTIFATWFTYDHDRTPMWLVATTPKIAPGTYMGTLYRFTGPPFNAVPFPPLGSPGGAIGTVVGTARFTFADGNTGTFAYNVNAETQTKNITRQLFQAPAGTVCQ
ncbi:MAG TPA: S8 family peptidase [Casimicrobiaceae bacterium]|jgi:serine protease|nr:S8 family peptidase [Casimicrobiaceae bacterium]